MQYLMVNRNHSTADEIYGSLVGNPPLSRTTVYNSLHAFVEAGLARVVTIEDNEARYDADISDHGHFKCDSCGRIYDFTVDVDCIQPKALEKFRINQGMFILKASVSAALIINKIKQEVIL